MLEFILTMLVITILNISVGTTVFFGLIWLLLAYKEGKQL